MAKPAGAGCDKDHALACPQRCPRCRAVALASEPPSRGEDGWGGADGERGGSRSARLTPPPCAARSLARPQDLAH